MRESIEVDTIKESQIIIRDLKISSIDNDIFSFINYDKKPTTKYIKLFGKTLWKINPKEKDLAIHHCLEQGGVLSGSNVLVRTILDNQKILKRNVGDIDFLVTKKSIHKIGKILKLYSDNNKNFRYTISYGDSYGNGKCDIDLIIINEEDFPKTYKVGNYLYADPLYILEKKLIDLNEKNKNDIETFYWRFSQFLK